MPYDIIHRTAYEYASDVSVSHHVARFTQRSITGQRSFAHELAVEPHPALTTHRDDYFGNRATFFTVASAHRTLVVVGRGRVEVLPVPKPHALDTPDWESVRAFCRADVSSPAPDATEFVFAS